MVVAERKHRVNRERLRLLVAEALLLRHKPDLLQDSELVEALGITGVGDGLWPKGTDLAQRVDAAGRRVSEQLTQEKPYRDHKSLLDAVLAGSSVAAWARLQGKERSYVSRTTWRAVTSWVTQRLLA